MALHGAANREYQRKWRAKRRAKYIALHGGKCCKCSSEKHLEFDHKDPATKISHKIWSWTEARIVEELKKCQLLCRLCHQAKTYTDRGYTDREHGTNLKYLRDKCRCVECRSAHAIVNRKYRNGSLKRTGCRSDAGAVPAYSTTTG